MVEYGCNVANKFGFMSDDDDFEDPRELIARAAEVEANKAAALKKAPPKTAAPVAKAEAPKPAAGKENRPVERAERGRGGRGGRGGERRGGPREFGNRPPREGGDLADRFGEAGGRGGRGGRGERRGGPRPFRGGRGNFNQAGGDRTSGDEAPKVEGAGFEEAPLADDGFRGRGRGRGGFRGRVGFAGRGRQYDRQSGSDRTGVRSTEKKEGHGKGNWGDVKDEIAAEIDAPAAEAENQEPAAPKEKTAEEIQFEKDMEEYKKMKTLKEYKAEKQLAEKEAFKTRKAGEGVQDNFGKLIPLQKEQQDNKDEDIIVMRKESNKKVLNIDIHFLEANRRPAGDRADRGERPDRGAPRGGRGGRGGQRGGRGGNGQGPSGGSYGRQQGAGHFDASSAEEFPALK